MHELLFDAILKTAGDAGLDQDRRVEADDLGAGNDVPDAANAGAADEAPQNLTDQLQSALANIDPRLLGGLGGIGLGGLMGGFNSRNIPLMLALGGGGALLANYWEPVKNYLMETFGMDEASAGQAATQTIQEQAAQVDPRFNADLAESRMILPEGNGDPRSMRVSPLPNGQGYVNEQGETFSQIGAGEGIANMVGNIPTLPAVLGMGAGGVAGQLGQDAIARRLGGFGGSAYSSLRRDPTGRSVAKEVLAELEARGIAMDKAQTENLQELARRAAGGVQAGMRRGAGLRRGHLRPGSLFNAMRGINPRSQSLLASLESQGSGPFTERTLRDANLDEITGYANKAYGDLTQTRADLPKFNGQALQEQLGELLGPKGEYQLVEELQRPTIHGAPIDGSARAQLINRRTGQVVPGGLSFDPYTMSVHAGKAPTTGPTKNLLKSVPVAPTGARAASLNLGKADKSLADRFKALSPGAAKWKPRKAGILAGMAGGGALATVPRFSELRQDVSK